MNNLDIRLQRRLYLLWYQYRKRRQYKFCNFLPIILEETEFDLAFSA